MPRFTQPPYLLKEVRVEYCDCTEPDPGILACEAPAVYRPRHPEETVFYQTFEQHFDKYVAAYEQRFEPRSGPLRHVVPEAVVQFLACGRLQGGLPAFVALRARANTWWLFHQQLQSASDSPLLLPAYAGHAAQSL